MKSMLSNQLLEQLETDTRQIILTLHYLLQEDPAVLLQQPAAGKWSVAQVIEHLNAYGRYYLPLMENKMHDSSLPAAASFTPGWLGDRFTQSMLPKADGSIANKMKTFKDYRPSADVDSLSVLNEFLAQEKKLLDLLLLARKADLNRIKISISIARLIKIKLGDTFRFVVAHHKRHFVQVANTLEIVKMNHGYTFPKHSIPA